VVEVAAAAIRGGADVIQLRDKTGATRSLITEASRLLPLARAAGIPLILNDRADVAAAIGADGVHLGQDDLPIAEARRILAPPKLIGLSTHSLEQALAAEPQRPDYIGIGPIFPTPTKPSYGSVGAELIGQARAHVSLPRVCIGGIDRENIHQVLEAGATCVAVVRAVCAAPDPETATRELKQTIQQFHRVPIHRSL
jgi:thiamine-phosphate pyrophosphorylase